MNDSKLLDIEASLEKAFIEEWINKLRIWAKIENNEEYLYRKEVLQDILETLERYPKGNNISIHISRKSKIFRYGTGWEDKRECVDIVSTGIYAIIKGTVDPFVYVLGKHLKIYKRNKPVDERRLEYNTSESSKNYPIEDFDFEDAWILEPVTEKNRKDGKR